MNLEPWPTVAPGTAPATLVRCLQYLLQSRGESVEVDGVHGPRTTAAVQAFQRAQGLPADGVAGPDTWRKLVVTVRRGSTGAAVKALQALELVHIPGEAPLVVDGDFGQETDVRVGVLQDLYGLAVDGVVGAQTWSFATASRPWPLVGEGHSWHTNHRVLTVQHLLRAHGATIAADGFYGPDTGAALRAFQQTLRSDDLGTTCGQRDWPALVVTVRRGDSGDAVAAAQNLLEGVAADGSFGAATEQAVTAFQQAWGLTPDGVVGARTWEALVKPRFD